MRHLPGHWRTAAVGLPALSLALFTLGAITSNWIYTLASLLLSAPCGIPLWILALGLAMLPSPLQGAMVILALTAGAFGNVVIARILCDSGRSLCHRLRAAA
ncbi:hypothetical protein [Nocardioides sp. Iso805N]|uniref:hypothetical protein n=1 Tax=Nocardioides sp. Iso805N TaxID=1283287 RepID=UPI0012F7D8A2|nr:hypothetical protein [Nocardioides sp. Iso805N]